MLTGRSRPSWTPVYEPWAGVQENVYAHRKRLNFILDAIEALRVEEGMASGGVSVLDVDAGPGS